MQLWKVTVEATMTRLSRMKVWMLVEKQVMKEILVVVVLAMIKETMKLVLMNIKMIMLVEVICKSLVVKVVNS